MALNKLHILSISEYNLIVNKDPTGSYDRNTRENLYSIIGKLRKTSNNLSIIERKIFDKFKQASFAALKERERKVKFELIKYRFSKRIKNSVRLSFLIFFGIIVFSSTVYEFLLSVRYKQKVDMVLLAGFEKVGLVSKEDFLRIRQEFTTTSTQLVKTKKNLTELNETIEEMIENNKVTSNLKYILKQIYNKPGTKYVKRSGKISLQYRGKEIINVNATDPGRWFLVGMIESGLIRVFYDNEELLEIRAIFGRKGEETPVGEYKIKNRLYKPTWYKGEMINGKRKVRIIPFGDPEHEIGYWWMGLKKLGEKVHGSYGIHGVNVSKTNEFYKKNFDWRSGSAGCPNIQDWYLHFLAKVLPLGTRINIVLKDKWKKSA